MPEALILASGSPARARLLRNAGVIFTTMPAAIDEARIKTALKREGTSVADCALTLAAAKAAAFAGEHPAALVIGADQMLSAGGDWFDKPCDRRQARLQLQALCGRAHELVTAACVMQGTAQLWHAVTSARLTMRSFSDAFVEAYLDAEGEAVVGSVGAYRIEGRGAQLFRRVEGDHFTIQGLPLLELLEFLRQRGAIPS